MDLSRQAKAVFLGQGQMQNIGPVGPDLLLHHPFKGRANKKSKGRR